MSPQEKVVYESPLKKFEHSVHTLYSDRRNEGEQVRMGSRSRASRDDPYTRSRKLHQLNDREPETARLGGRPFNSTSKKHRYVSRSPTQNSNRYISRIDEYNVGAPSFALSEVVHPTDRMIHDSMVHTSSFDPLHRSQRTHLASPEFDQKKTVISHDPELRTEVRSEFYDEPISSRSKYSKPVQSKNGEINIEYKHKFHPGITHIKSSPRTTTVVEETEEYENGEKVVERTIYENGVIVGREEIPQDGLVTFSPHGTNGHNKLGSFKRESKWNRDRRPIEEAADYERRSPFRSSPYKSRPVEDHFQNIEIEHDRPAPRRNYVDKLERIQREHDSEHDDYEETIPEDLHQSSKPRRRSSRGYNYRSGHSNNPEDRYTDTDQNDNYIDSRSSRNKNEPEVHYEETDNGYTQTFIRHHDERPDGKGLTYEKTIVTLHGRDGATDRERAILKDHVEQQIEESQALVNDLMESNRRHANRLH